MQYLPGTDEMSVEALSRENSLKGVNETCLILHIVEDSMQFEPP